jgi:Ca-activated chloride channel family protein
MAHDLEDPAMNGVLGFDWQRPEALWWLCAAPALVGLAWWSWRASASARALVAAPAFHARLWPRFAPRRELLRLVAGVLALVFLVLALAGPVRGYTLREVRKKGLDMVVCLDTSRSMLVQDLSPDRLTRAKREVRGLLERLQGDRAALLAFSGDVREVAPLTSDMRTLATFLDTLNPADNQKGGTDVGAVLERALGLFDGRSGAHEVIVLLTDGEDLGGQGAAVARRAAERGIRVHVCGIGTEDGGKIPDGRGFVRGPEGKEVVSRLDAATLRSIAQVSGGDYVGTETSPTPLEELWTARISRMEGREYGSGRERIPHDRYQWPLVVAALCVCVESGLRGRRSGP